MGREKYLMDLSIFRYSLVLWRSGMVFIQSKSLKNAIMPLKS